MPGVEGEKRVGLRDGRAFRRCTSSGGMGEASSGVGHGRETPDQHPMGRTALLGKLNER